MGFRGSRVQIPPSRLWQRHVGSMIERMKHRKEYSPGPASPRLICSASFVRSPARAPRPMPRVSVGAPIPTRDWNLIFMRIVRALCLASLGAAVLSARGAGAQDTREVVLRLHRAGDTVSIRGAAVTIDHTIEAGNTDSAGIVRVPDLLDGGHIIEVVARGYQAYFDNFNSGAERPAAHPARAPPHSGVGHGESEGPEDGPEVRRVRCSANEGAGQVLHPRAARRCLRTSACQSPQDGCGRVHRVGTARRVPARHAVTGERVVALLRRGGPRRRSDLSVRRRQPARPRQDLRRAARGDRALRAACDCAGRAS